MASTKRFAAATDVPINQSKSDIERVLERYGASSFGYATEDRRALIQFKAQDRFVRFILTLPEKDEKRFTHKFANQYDSWGTRRSDDDSLKQWEQACRQAWRALLLIVKAKLEAVEAKITTFEDEFLPYTVLPDGKTVSEWMQPQIDEAYKTGLMPSSLLALPPPHVDAEFTEH